MDWLSVLIFLPVLGGLWIGVIGHNKTAFARWAALAITSTELLIALGLWWNAIPNEQGYFYIVRAPWVPAMGIQFLLGMDGISLLLVLLTALLGPVVVLVSWNAIQRNWPAFAALLLATQAGIMGVFLALDLVLFYVFWELMLVPMYFLVGVWGHKRRLYAAYKFFLFTVTGSLLMLIAILGLYFTHGEQTGIYTFDYFELLQVNLPDNSEMWLMLGFFVAFAVKIPLFPIHSWLPDAHTEAPTAGSIFLAGLLLKTGAYGLLRFCLPLFPEASTDFAPIGMTLGVIGILYGALLALVQEDMKRLIAYSSISHLGFVVFGIYAWNQEGLNGAVILMLAHGVSTGAMFAMVGMLEERCGTRLLAQLGGLLSPIPRLASLLLLFTLSAMGMPGLANFIGEFLVLAGVFQVSAGFAVAGALGIIAGVVYLLWMYQRAVLGEITIKRAWTDLNRREAVPLGLLALVVLWLGLYPAPFLDSLQIPVTAIIESKSSVPTGSIDALR
ncbi:complex I subunit 4 family protein [Nitrosomonas communis]|uniref:NADH-quinone oxidoreductase subunit M n=1 Tax=Nitrosomonas communis TaxID=44574 RepID=A0A1H2TY29_9PROT|nr:NADH-quinone oxidoreductase subunit M [Nitrosomonas communis]SDW48647.1 NADH-quinone oxidoreductase subunit M [Nitrosomonas communis]